MYEDFIERKYWWQAGPVWEIVIIGLVIFLGERMEASHWTVYFLSNGSHQFVTIYPDRLQTKNGTFWNHRDKVRVERNLSGFYFQSRITKLLCVLNIDE